MLVLHSFLNFDDTESIQMNPGNLEYHCDLTDSGCISDFLLPHLFETGLNNAN